MRRKHLMALFVGLFLFLCSSAVNAENEQKTSTKEDRLSGTVHMIDKDGSAIIIRKGAVQRRIIYSAATKFTIQNKRTASIDDVIVGRQVTCLGEFNDKTQLVATRVDIRTK